jgi:hypothetical protein
VAAGDREVQATLLEAFSEHALDALKAPFFGLAPARLKRDVLLRRLIGRRESGS